METLPPVRLGVSLLIPYCMVEDLKISRGEALQEDDVTLVVLKLL